MLRTSHSHTRSSDSDSANFRSERVYNSFAHHTGDSVGSRTTILRALLPRTLNYHLSHEPVNASMRDATVRHAVARTHALRECGPAITTRSSAHIIRPCVSACVFFSPGFPWKLVTEDAATHDDGQKAHAHARKRATADACDRQSSTHSPECDCRPRLTSARSSSTPKRMHPGLLSYVSPYSSRYDH